MSSTTTVSGITKAWRTNWLRVRLRWTTAAAFADVRGLGGLLNYYARAAW